MTVVGERLVETDLADTARTWTPPSGRIDCRDRPRWLSITAPTVRDRPLERRDRYLERHRRSRSPSTDRRPSSDE